MAMHNMTIRIDETLKSEAARVAEYYGFDLSSVTRAFYKRMVETKSIPLSLNLHDRFAPFENEQEALDKIDSLAGAVIDDAG